MNITISQMKANDAIQYNTASTFQEDIQAIKTRLHNSDYFIFKILDNHKDVGSLWVSFNEDFGCWELLYIELDINHQHQGIAREALQQVLEFMIDELGRTKCFAAIESANNNALKLFNGVGFFNTQRLIEDKKVFEKQL